MMSDSLSLLLHMQSLAGLSGYQVELCEYHGICVFTWGTTACHVIMYIM